MDGDAEDMRSTRGQRRVVGNCASRDIDLQESRVRVRRASESWPYKIKVEGVWRRTKFMGAGKQALFLQG